MIYGFKEKELWQIRSKLLANLPLRKRGIEGDFNS